MAINLGSGIARLHNCKTGYCFTKLNSATSGRRLVPGLCGRHHRHSGSKGNSAMTRIDDETDLREFYGKEPSERALKKVIGAFDKHCRHFISLSPFLVLSSSSPDGHLDCSPRGDPPGFVQVLDDRTLLLPDRPGNNRLDTLSNLVANPEVALIFFLPGVNETLRVNGTAEVVEDHPALGGAAINGRAPKSGLVITAREIYLHCAKALIRSKLWDEEAQIERSSFPTLGQMITDQAGGMDGEAQQASIEIAYKETLY
jgi:PPOX class probable FMN-dependent enzyme